MLTQSERKWLKARRIRQAKHHIYHRNEFFIWSGYHSAKDEIADLKDALKFSERVAAKLAAVYREIAHVFGGDNPPLPCKYCPANTCCKLSNGCDEGILKWARLAVQEEMDADGK